MDSELKYYRLTEMNPMGWEDTNLILGKFNGIHYSTIMTVSNIYRKFIVHCTEDELLMIKLSMNNNINIEIFEQYEMEYLIRVGYIR
jgi:hypothetical protein